MGTSKIYLALEKADLEIKEAGHDEILFVPPTISGQGERPARKVTSQGDGKAPEKSLSQPLHSVFTTEFVAAEQFRKLRTHIIRTDSSGSTKTIMVTSAVQGEGKSFVATNLAIGFAQDFDLHSLLVDCDLRNPSLAPRFGFQNKRGIADYLVGTEDISAFLIKTNLDKLSLLTCGSIQGNPSELMGSNKMASLVKELKSRYSDRFIIFDSTPLLATSEAEILTKLVDGIIVVVRAGKTPRETVEQAMALLGKDKILGVVLNDVEFKSSGLFLRYFGSDGYYYGYGQEKKSPQRPSGWVSKIRLSRKKI
jgi:protein-tyrosine kinase